MTVTIPQSCYQRPSAALDTPPLTPPFLFRPKQRIPSVDGPSDLPQSEHPNFAKFAFSFETPAKSSLQEAKQELEHQLLDSSVGQARSEPFSGRCENEQSFPEPSPHFSRSPATKNYPGLLNNSSCDRRLVNYSRPSFADSRSPDIPELSKTALAPSSRECQFGPQSSRTSSSLTPLRSAKIRADDSWLKRDSHKVTFAESRGKSDLWPAPLRILPKPSAVNVSSEFLSKVQPLVSPATPPTTTSGTEASGAKTDPQSQEEPDKNTSRITRENILRHLLSAESLRELSAIGDSAELAAEEDEPRKIFSKMSMLHPDSAAAMTEHRREAIRLAKAQEKSVIEKCKRSDQAIPGYIFEELIGKGSYGRVYKGRQTSTSKIVAIKVLDVDEADFHAIGEAKDEQIRDFNREIRILRQAQDSGAPNMNQIIEALPVHSQLWMICEYCPGGSVKTLMRATNDRLAEKYIVVIARELAKALKGLHDAGIMHRDVKAANVLVHEEGHVQLCDFGVAGVLEQRTDKRRTFIGTLHWMPPELWSDKPEYSDEVDVWEYGVTLYECALGKPPNSDLRERQQLQSRMRRMKQPISLPEHEEFGEELRSIVKYTLTPDAKSRPSMKDVLEHEFIHDTEGTHPTNSLIQLVQVYYQWLHSGGQRASLFMPGGAVVTDAPDSIIAPSDEWNFSTTDNFEKRNSKLVEALVLSSPDSTEGEATPKGPKLNDDPPPLRDLKNMQKLNFESRVKRGADLSNLFDQEKPNYEYKIKRDFVPAVEERRISDLPFRAMAEDRPTSIASNVIDLGDFDSDDYAIAAPKREEKIRLADAATIRAKRGDSKGPRDSTTAINLTARRASSADDLIDGRESSRVAAQDFAFPPKEWADDKSSPTSAGTRDLTEKPSTRDASRKTMEWSFATAMSTASETDDSAGEAPEPSRAQLDKTNKHATLDWSFSNAMAEADMSSVVPGTNTTPRRPNPLQRTMTQPVTSADFHEAEEFPRPSTAQSEAYSESSMSSADFDPFSLDQGEETPDPSAIDELNVSGFYNTRGRSLLPEHRVPYSSTVAGPAPYMLGRPARVDEEGHPGPLASLARAATDTFSKKNKKKSTSSSSSAGGRPIVQMPEAMPPDEAAMAGNASNEVVESELSRLLGGLQQSLAGATQALGIMRKSKKEERLRKKAEKERGKGSGDEWEDEV